MHHVVVVFLYKTPEEAWELFEQLSENYTCMLLPHILICLGNKEVKGGFMRFHIQLTFLVKLML